MHTLTINLGDNAEGESGAQDLAALKEAPLLHPTLDYLCQEFSWRQCLESGLWLILGLCLFACKRHHVCIHTDTYKVCR